MNNAPIGIFDSGLGGLSVWREIRRMLPAESLVYYGDGKNCPYGDRPKEEIITFADQALGWMLGKDVKLAVVACNTATAAAIEYLRGKYDIPIVGMEPAVKPAALSTRTGVVAVLATATSLKGDLYTKTAAKYGMDVKLLPAVGEGFVELVENGEEDSGKAVETVGKVIEPLIEAGADRIVLGCTHYHFLSNAIHRVIAGRDVEIVDSAPAVVKRVEYLLGEHGIEASPGHRPVYEFHTLAGEDYLQKLIEKSRKAFDMGF